MKLYELTFDIRDGEQEYLKSRIRVFRGISQANRYGVISEYEENTSKLASKPPAPRKREKARENTAWDFGRVYRFNGARELEFVEGSDGLYQVYLGQRFPEIPEKLNNQSEDKTMKAAEFMTAHEKELVLKAWKTFFKNGLRWEHFTDRLYKHLSLHCSFTAHYEQSGFYQTCFSEPENTVTFLRQFDKDFGCVPVEYGGTW